MKANYYAPTVSIVLCNTASDIITNSALDDLVAAKAEWFIIE